MRGILADINVIAQAKALLFIWTSDSWRRFLERHGLGRHYLSHS